MFEIDIAERGSDSVLLKVGFGEPATGGQVVMAAERALAELSLDGGRLVKINGQISVAAAMLLAHSLGHIYGAVAAYDPKLGKYIVCISHDPDYPIGDLID